MSLITYLRHFFTLSLVFIAFPFCLLLGFMVPVAHLGQLFTLSSLFIAYIPNDAAFFVIALSLSSCQLVIGVFPKTLILLCRGL